MSTVAVLVRSRQSRRGRDALEALKLIGRMVLEVVGATEIGRLATKGIKYLIKRHEKMQGLADKLEGLRAGGNDLLQVLLPLQFHGRRQASLDAIVRDVAAYLDGCQELLDWSDAQRFLRVSELQRAVNTAEGTLGRLRHRFDVELKLTHDAKLDEVNIKIDSVEFEARANQDRTIDRLTTLEMNQAKTNNLLAAIIERLDKRVE